MGQDADEMAVQSVSDKFATVRVIYEAERPGCMRAALGMQILCERLSRAEEASRYADLAQRCWRRADRQSYAVELAALREEYSPQRAQRPGEDKVEARAR